MKPSATDSSRTSTSRTGHPLAPAAWLIAFMAAVTLLPTSLLAATNSVSSPAGFVRLVVPPQTNLFAAMPFVAADEGIAGVFSNQLTGATNENAADRIQKWDVSVQQFTNAYKYSDGVWYADFEGFAPCDMSFSPGEGFFIQNRQSATQTVFLCGQVVLDNASTQTMASGLAFFGYPFSTARKLNDTSLAADGAQAASAWTNADQISVWDIIQNQYGIFGLKDSDSLWHSTADWNGSSADDYLQLGQGQWFQRVATNAFDWTESRPYEQLFPTDGNPPTITDIRPNAEQDQMTLSIDATGIGTVEIYYKDMTATNEFSSTGWQIAATNVEGGGEIEWTDEGSGSRGAVNTVYARYYLVGNSTMDSDGDSQPDSREVFVLGTDPDHNDAATNSPAILIRLDFGSVSHPEYKVADGTVDSVAAGADSVFGTSDSDIWDYRDNGSGSYLGLTNTTDGAATDVGIIFSGTFNTGSGGGGSDGIDLRRDYIGAPGQDMTFVVTNLQPNTETRLFFYAIEFWNAPYRVQIGSGTPVLVTAGTGTNGSEVIGTTDGSGVLSGSVTRALDINGDATELDITGIQIYQAGSGSSTNSSGPSAPTVSNASGATNVTSNSAHLCGDLTSTGGTTTSVRVYWGTTDGGTDSEEWENVIDMGTLEEGVFSSQVTGLTASATYYYRTYATNSEGAAWASSSASFSTYGGAWSGGAATFVRLDFGSVSHPEYKVADGTVESVATNADPAFGSFGANVWDYRDNGSGNYANLKNTADGSAAMAVGIIFSGTFNTGSGGGGSDGIDLRRDYIGAPGQDMTFVVSNLMPNAETRMFFYGIEFYNAPYRVQLGGGSPVLVTAGTSGSGAEVFGTADASGVLTGSVTRALDVNPSATELDIAGIQIFQPDSQLWIKNVAPVGLGGTSVSMNGSLASTGGAPANVWLCWGTNDCGSGDWPNVVDLGVMNAGPLSNQVTGLSFTNTVYYYRYVASNTTCGVVWATPTVSFGGTGDTDGDGMPNGWELAHCLDPLLNDAALDPDGDALTNLEEYRLGTNPHNADTDGDGMSDYVEARVAFSDPTVADFNGVVTTNVTVAGSAATGWLGTWTTEGASIYAGERSGYVEYSVTFPSNNIYALKVDATQHNSLTSQNEFDLSLYLDGAFSGRQMLLASYGSTGSVTFFLPMASAGTHTVRLRWHNLEANTFLQILSLSLESYGGDWQAHRQANVSGLAAQPSTSLVSPVCLEGESYYQDMLAVSADYAPEGETQQVITVKHGIGQSWYANVLLSPTNATAIQVLDQDGAVSHTTTVAWAEMNILSGTYTNDVLVRAGSSLLLNAHPDGATNGTVTITVLSGTTVLTNFATAVDHPVPYLFGSEGTFTVTGSYSNDAVTTNASVTVRAVAASFPSDEVVCVAGESRTWDCPGIPANDVAIEYDAALDIYSGSLGGGGLQFALLDNSDEPLYMVARLGEGGPVLDSAKVSTVHPDHGQYLRVVTSFADGSRLVEVRLQLGYVPSDIRVELHVFAGGVTFDDGTIDRTLTASDFNAVGVATYYLVQGASVTTSVCHTTKIYQGSKYIGGN